MPALPHIMLNNFLFVQTLIDLYFFSIWSLNDYQRCNFCHSINIYINFFKKHSYLTASNRARGNHPVKATVIWYHRYPVSAISWLCFCSVTPLLFSYYPEYCPLCLRYIKKRVFDKVNIFPTYFFFPFFIFLNKGGFRIGNTCIPVADSCWYMANPTYF